MAGAAHQRLELPRSTRRYGFSLTALADAMFQLLVFFMLSANTSTYSLLNIRGGGIMGSRDGALQPGQANAPPAGNATRADQTAIWSLRADGIVSGGQRFEFDRLGDLARAMRDSGTPKVLLVTQQGASVQGLVRVLEALAAHDVTAVQVTSAVMQ
ncbi:ExbD/TolR family protein [Paracoccus pacificus]|uniref:ExbD/TolR family protein n=1 Tax=Paracoccus pacificus TaxID=1463598 RepID=A0ABW4R811_9RHOB